MTKAAELPHRAGTAISLSKADHAHSLASAARSALAAGDARLAWLLADRLCRITAETEALPLLLRSAAFAVLGRADSSRADLDRAAAVNPEHLLVAEALLRHPDKARRLQGVRVMLASGDRKAVEKAYASLARDGMQAVLFARVEDDTIRVEAVWKGEQAPELLATDGSRNWPIGIFISDAAAEAGAFAFHGSGHLAWPCHVPALQLVAREGALIEPEIVRHFGEPVSDATHSPKIDSGALVVVPVYGDAAATEACIASLIAQGPSKTPFRIAVVDDASPDAKVRTVVDRLAPSDRMIVMRNPVNLGFAAGVNRALALRQPGEDVLLLNADTILPPKTISRLRDVAYSDSWIGTVTPLSNNGEETSFPDRFLPNPLLPTEEIARIDAIAAETNADCRIDLPNGIGFCLFVKAAALEATGYLSTSFGRGYCEDVEFCLRIAKAGYRNVCSADIYVGHAGARSFRHEKQALVRRNLGLIADSFPDYPEKSALFVREDPLLEPIRQIERRELETRPSLRLALFTPDFPETIGLALLQAVPGDGGGRVAVFPKSGDGGDVRICAADGGMPQNLTFEEPAWLHWCEELARSGRIGELIIADPARQLGRAAGILAGSTKGVTYLFASSEASQSSPTRHFGAGVGFAASAAIARLTKRAGWLDAISILSDWTGAGSVPRQATEGMLAILPLRQDRETDNTIRAVASGLAESSTAPGIAVLGRHEGDLDLMQQQGLWVTGELEMTSLAAWLDFAGAGGLFVPDREFGLCLPWVSEWARSGFPVGCFGSEDADDGCLRLDPALSDDAVSEAVARWFEAVSANNNERPRKKAIP